MVGRLIMNGLFSALVCILLYVIDPEETKKRMETILVNFMKQVNGSKPEIDKSHGPKVINGGTKQRVDFPEKPPVQPFIRREFFIVSEMNGKVLDIEKGNRNPGALVIVWSKKFPPEKNQLWYFDGNGFIRSALNDLVPESQGGIQVKMVPSSQADSQQWRIVGNRIVSKTGECLDIKNEQWWRDGAEVISYVYKASWNQHWRLDFI